MSRTTVHSNVGRHNPALQGGRERQIPRGCGPPVGPAGDACPIRPAGRCAEDFPVSPFEILDRQLLRRSGSRAERAGGGSGKLFSAGLNGPEGHQGPISCGWQVSEISKSIIPSGLYVVGPKMTDEALQQEIVHLWKEDPVHPSCGRWQRTCWSPAAPRRKPIKPTL